VKRKRPVASTIEEAVIASLSEGHREFLRFVSRRARNLADAEDIVQEFYLKAIRSARTINEQGALKGWLAQVLRRTVIDYYRRASVRKTALLRLQVSEGSVVKIDDDAERAVCSCLYRILPMMPSDDAQLIWQVDLLSQPRGKVAKALGISANNLGVRLHRARRALHSALMRYCTTCPTHGFLNCACEEGLESVKGASSRSGPRVPPPASSGAGRRGGGRGRTRAAG
jgi:RNA polymerase sigma-70 factor (ECF subfamily)